MIPFAIHSLIQLFQTLGPKLLGAWFQRFYEYFGFVYLRFRFNCIQWKNSSSLKQDQYFLLSYIKEVWEETVWSWSRISMIISGAKTPIFLLCHLQNVFSIFMAQDGCWTSSHQTSVPSRRKRGKKGIYLSLLRWFFRSATQSFHWQNLITRSTPKLQGRLRNSLLSWLEHV